MSSPPVSRIAEPCPAGLRPGFLYTLRGFKDASGIGHSLIRRARNAGIALPTLTVGRRKFIEGKDAIQFLKSVAKLSG